MDALIKKVMAFLRMNDPDLESALDSLASQGKVVIEGREKVQVYLTHLYQAEANVAVRLKSLIHTRRRSSSGI